VRDGSARTEERGAQIDIDGGVPALLVELVERRGLVDRRHVDEDVEAAEGGSRAFDERAAVVGIAEVR
jgi:hypothetical protein